MPSGYSRKVQNLFQPTMTNPADIENFLHQGKEVMAYQDFWFISATPDYPHLGLKGGLPACFKRQQKWCQYIDWTYLSTLSARWSDHGLIFTHSTDDIITTIEYGYIKGLKAIIIDPVFAGTGIYLPIPPCRFNESMSVPRFCHLETNVKIHTEPQFQNEDGIQIYGIICDGRFRIIDKRSTQLDARRNNHGRIAITYLRNDLNHAS